MGGRPGDLHLGVSTEGSAIHHDPIHLFKSIGSIAQRACGQQVAISQSSIAVDYHDFQIPVHSEMLQSIVADHDVAAAGYQ
jgi:hypothetical protein